MEITTTAVIAFTAGWLVRAWWSRRTAHSRLRDLLAKVSVTNR
jgi:hypothetical protein